MSSLDIGEAEGQKNQNHHQVFFTEFIGSSDGVIKKISPRSVGSDPQHHQYQAGAADSHENAFHQSTYPVQQRNSSLDHNAFLITFSFGFPELLFFVHSAPADRAAPWLPCF